MSTSPAIKAIWLIILALFLIGLGLTGVGLVLGGKVPTQIGPTSGIEFYDFRTGTFFDRHMEERRAPVTATSANILEGVVIHSIDIEAPIADIKLVPTDADFISYTIRSDDASHYRVDIDEGEFSIVSIDFPRGITINPFLNMNQRDEIVVEIPRGMYFSDVSLQSVAGSICIIENLNAAELDIASVAGTITLQGVGLDIPQGAQLSIRAVSGNVVASDANLQNLDLEIVAGSATMHIRNLDTFHVTANTASGSVTKDGQSIVSGVGQGQTGIRGSMHYITVELVAGNVELLTAVEVGGAVPDPATEGTPEVPTTTETPTEATPETPAETSVTETPPAGAGQAPSVPANVTPRAPRALGGPSNPPISAQQAVEIAAQHLGSIGASDARFDYVYMDREDGIWVWSVEFDAGHLSYEFYIDLNNGSILEFVTGD